jgi:hypothetical protein
MWSRDRIRRRAAAWIFVLATATGLVLLVLCVASYAYSPALTRTTPAGVSEVRVYEGAVWFTFAAAPKTFGLATAPAPPPLPAVPAADPTPSRPATPTLVATSGGLSVVATTAPAVAARLRPSTAPAAVPAPAAPAGTVVFAVALTRSAIPWPSLPPPPALPPQPSYRFSSVQQWKDYRDANVERSELSALARRYAADRERDPFVGFNTLRYRDRLSLDVVPLGVPLSLIAIYDAWWLKAYLRRRRHRRAGRCARCGYDVRFSNERCPECGHELPPRAVAVIPVRPRMVLRRRRPRAATDPRAPLPPADTSAAS